MPTTERRIGRYELLEPVGRGAMGVVYRAEDPAIHRTVAVKVLHAPNGLTAKQAVVARERFIREGQAAGGIDHPNIIRVFDVGENVESGEMYIVMEFVSGPSLESSLHEDALDPKRALALIGQIAAGLDAAHARGFVHRDIKPSNILLTDDGTAKIADFGITYVATSALTQDLSELGTPAYMSPEQVSGKALTSKADLFSLGVLAYEILTGHKPFRGADIVSMAHAIAHAEPVPASVANPELPQALDRVLARMLAKEPSERFGSGREFHETLLPCFSDPASEVSPRRSPAARKRSYAVWGWAGAALVLLAAVVIMMIPRGEPAVSAPPATASGSEPAPKAGEAPPPKAQAKVVVPEPAPPPAKKPSPPKPAKKQPSAAKAPPAIPESSTPPKVVGPEGRTVPAKAAAVVAPAATSDVTISFAHRIRRGTLIVSLDGVTIFDEKFSKSRLAIVQTTIWDPVRAPAGAHTLSATVNGEDGKTYVSDSYAFDFPSGKAIELRIGLKGDTLTVKQNAS